MPKARAQGFARSQDIETSIRSAGMGGATTAVGWGEPGVWGNPASLSGTLGVGWLDGRTRLVPNATSVIRFKTRRLLVGGAGVGFSFMGDPVRGLGVTRIEEPTRYGTDPVGNPTGPWQIGERIEAWGFGVSPLRLLDAAGVMKAPAVHALASRMDLAFGYQHKQTRVVQQPGAVGEAANFDWGLSGRFVALAGGPDGQETRIELMAGFAELNADEGSTFDLGSFGNAGPSTRMRRIGAALRAQLPFGAGFGGTSSPWWPAVPSAVGVGIAYDREERSLSGSPIVQDLDHWGLEISLMDILTGRAGHVNDPAGNTKDATFGLGLRAPIGPWASLGYDWARFPQSRGLEHLDRHGWSVWLHPGAIWESTKQR